MKSLLSKVITGLSTANSSAPNRYERNKHSVCTNTIAFLGGTFSRAKAIAIERVLKILAATRYAFGESKDKIVVETSDLE